MHKHHIKKIIHKALQKLKITVSNIEITHPENLEFGDYTTNVAMQLARQEKKSPISIAEEIIKQIKSDNTIEELTIAKPGFINIKITKQALLTDLYRAAKKDPLFFHPPSQHGKKIIFEFTDPNPFKEFHIGHLFTNCIGESLSRIYEANAAEVKRANYQGDVGMHVAKSIWGIIQKLQEENTTIQELEKKTLHNRVNFLGKAYAQGATAYKDDKKAQEEIKDINYLVYICAQEYLAETQKWEPQVNYAQHLTKTKIDKNIVKELYTKGRTWSLEYFELIYARLGTQFDFYYFESFTGEYGMKVVTEYLTKGIFEKSNGAIVFPGDKHGLHTRVFVNSLGLPTYETKELGLAPKKYKDFPYDTSVIITGNEIDEYFKVLITALKLINPTVGERTKHLSHGMVKLPSGKMSSRTGSVITGERLLDETKCILKKRITESKKIEEKNIEELSDILAIASIKYSFLKVALGKDIIFDFNESVSFEGNSAPYLIYTYVRTHSILRKISEKEINPSETQPVSQIGKQTTEEESLLLRTLYQYPEVVEFAANHFSPHSIASYLYTVAQLFNGLYQKHSIIQAKGELKQLRLMLTLAVSNVLKEGLNLLGIQTVERM